MEQAAQVQLYTSYLKLGIAAIVGAALVLAVYFMVNNGASAQQKKNANAGVANASSYCICPSCGSMIHRPKGMDCEDVACPTCGSHMTRVAMLAAATTNNQGTTRIAPLTQNQRETLAERGMFSPQPLGPSQVSPRPMTQNQRETLAEQGRAAPSPTPVHTFRQRRTNPALAAAAAMLPPLSKPSTCVCPHCGKRLDRAASAHCSQMLCPTCGTQMTNAVVVGPRNVTPAPKATLAAVQQVPAATPCPPATATLVAGGTPCMGGGGGFNGGGGRGGGAPPCVGGGGGFNGGGGHGGGAPPCVGGGGRGDGGGFGAVAAAGAASASTPAPQSQPQPQPQPQSQPQQQITYTSTVRDIVAQNCLRCHGGPIRNLSTYQNVKAYVDNGLLIMMVQPGGPMSRFLSAHQSHEIVSWAKAGAPQ